MELLSNGWNIFLIVLGFGLLIFVHELGHFVAARWARIRCESFAIGMGPVVLAYRAGVGWHLGSTDAACRAKFGTSALEMSKAELTANGVGETEYSLRALPLGGFVRMLGQDDMNPGETSTQVGSYQQTPIWKRMIVVSAGVVSNVLCAVALFVVAFMAGVQFDAPVVGATLPGSPAATAVASNAAQGGVTTPGIQPGDTVVSIDGSPTLTFADIQIAGAMNRKGSSLDVVVTRPNVPTPLSFTLEPKFEPKLGLQEIGIVPSRTTTLMVGRPSEMPAIDALLESAGISPKVVPPGSTLVALNGEPVHASFQLAHAATASDGHPMQAQWRLPNGSSATTQILPLAEYQALYSASGSVTQDAEPVLRTVTSGLLGLTPLTKITGVSSDSPNAGRLQRGDIIVRVEDLVAPTPSVVQDAIKNHQGGDSIALQILRSGAPLEVVARRGDGGRLGITLGDAWSEPVIGKPVKELGPPANQKGPARPSSVAALDLLPLSRITKVGNTPISNWLEMRAALQVATAEGARLDQPTSVKLEWLMPTPGKDPASGTMVVHAQDARALQQLSWQSPINDMLFEPLNVTLQADGNPITAAAMGFRQTGKMITMTYLTLDRLVRGSVGVEQLRGPVGIVHLGSRVADRGMMYLLFFLAAISVNLAVINFLPLPIVDGGLFLYLVYERLTGKPPSQAFQSGAIAVGLFLIGGIFLFTFYQDVMRLVTG
jgi:regulator of sigma E protease